MEVTRKEMIDFGFEEALNGWVVMDLIGGYRVSIQINSAVARIDKKGEGNLIAENTYFIRNFKTPSDWFKNRIGIKMPEKQLNKQL